MPDIVEEEESEIYQIAQFEKDVECGEGEEIEVNQVSIVGLMYI